MSRKHKRRQFQGALNDQEPTSLRQVREDKERSDFGLNSGPRKAPLIKPRNPHQAEYFKYLESHDIDIIFALGPAGTGKTLLAVSKAIEALKSGEIKKIVITRPAVSVDEEHGFLPGDIIAKMTPWMRPVFDIFNEHFTPKHLKFLLEQEIVEIAPLAFMRGRTFKDAWVIADEMQNATESQMKMLLTRIGEGSKFVITGDLNQHDRGYEKNGLHDFTQRFANRGSSFIRTIEFEGHDIERHAAVAEVLRVYGEIDDGAKIASTGR
jgi:phosphate starvation-inducible PhoH-like protein